MCELSDVVILTSAGRQYRNWPFSRVCELSDVVILTDPPYYDNICYADISDFSYVWLRLAAPRPR